MKKLLAAIIFTAFAVSGVFAIGMSGGAGVSVSATSWNASYTSSGQTFTYKDAIVPFGAKVFFDATYVQVSAGYIMATKAKTSGTNVTTTSYDNKLGYLTLAALGKYPFKLGPVTLFPLAGIEYDLNVSHPSADNFEGFIVPSPTASDYNQFWIKGGVGADIAVGGHFYVRPEALYGFKPLNSDEQTQVNNLKSIGYSNVSLRFGTIDVSVLVGYKL